VVCEAKSLRPQPTELRDHFARVLARALALHFVPRSVRRVLSHTVSETHSKVAQEFIAQRQELLDRLVNSDFVDEVVERLEQLTR
jgi:hypothetical protein